MKSTPVRLAGQERVMREFADPHLQLTRDVRIKVEGHDDVIENLKGRVGRLEAALPTP